MRTFDLILFGVHVRVACPDALSAALVDGNFGAFATRASRSTPDYSYTIQLASGDLGYTVSAEHGTTTIAQDAYELLYNLEKSITIDVQLRRPDLFFVHSAALQRGGQACLLVAPPGSGKSTTAWALLHHGFGYLSDELAPIDLATMTVLPYPHALCLKRHPPARYALPSDTIVTGRTLHVPSASIASDVDTPVPLGFVFFNQYDPAALAPTSRAISGAAATALLYANGLNQLAHSGDGLAAAAAIAARADCHQLTTADLTQTCELVTSIMEG